MRSLGLLVIVILATPWLRAASAQPAGDVVRREHRKKACDAGNKDACRDLALLLLVGEGGPRDAKAALQMWFEECLGEDYDACQNVGWAYDRGIGVPKNETIGAGYQRLACEHAPYSGACTEYYLAVLLGQGVARDEKLALDKLDQDCNAGILAACANAAVADELGLAGRKVDRARAVATYHKACDAGHANGCARLGRLLLARKPADPAGAAAALRTACDHYDGDSCAELASLVAPGDAAALRKRACTLGVTTACGPGSSLRR